jgi:uncharacterized protein (DUF302 family)
LLLGLAHHHINPLNSILTGMKAARNILRQTLNHTLILPPEIFIAESGQQVFLVQLIQLRGLLRNIR